MSSIKGGRYKPKLYVCIKYGRNLVRRRRRLAQAPTSNTTSHYNHEKNQFLGFLCFPIWVWGSAWRPLRPLCGPLQELPELPKLIYRFSQAQKRSSQALLFKALAQKKQNFDLNFVTLQRGFLHTAQPSGLGLNNLKIHKQKQ